MSVEKTSSPFSGKGGFAPQAGNTRVAIATLGCKVNQYESAAMSESLENRGLSPATTFAEADFIIINTCTVTGRTDYQSRQLIRRAQKANPRAAVIVTGCYAQTSPRTLAGMPGVASVVGNEDKTRIAELIVSLQEGRDGGENSAGACPGQGMAKSGSLSEEIPFVSRFPGHTRAFLKIQDGCNAFCSYCIVPYARGRSRSLEPEEVLARLARLARRGYREVVLTGIHLGAYGKDRTDGTTLAGILRHVEAHRTVDRLRLSSLEPGDIDEELLAVMGAARVVCPHLHIPLQSGDDDVLTRMGRKYDRTAFRELVARVRSLRPDMTIGLDVMTGFPGEDEKAFENTLELVASMPVAYLHVFPYSRRPGTAAAAMNGQVREEDKKRRALALRQLGAEKRRGFLERFIGATLPVLIEGRKDRLKGFSHNYLPVVLRNDEGATVNTIVPVRIEDRENDVLVGSPVYE